MKLLKKSSKIVLALFLLSLFFTSTCYSQNDTQSTKSEFWKNVRFGGGLGLSLGNGFFSASVSPNAVYQFSNEFGLGVGLSATYNSSKNFFKSTILGGSILALYNPINELQLSTEFEQLNVKRTFEDAQFKSEPYWYPALFMGAGYRVGNVTLGIRYDVLYDANKSIYADPWIPFVRVFF